MVRYIDLFFFIIGMFLILLLLSGLWIDLMVWISNKIYEKNHVKQKSFFTIPEAGWEGKWEAGETATIPVDVVGTQNKRVMLGGKILVSESMLVAYGPDFLRKLNDSQNAIIVVIDDDSYKEMTPSERVEFLNTVAV